jgi:KipI family sensor histidine kinase inhibitor
VQDGAARTVEIPVCYGGEHGADLDETAALCGLAADELVRLHQAEGLRVYMLGFAPGAPYIGLLDAKLAVPRLATPRTLVPAGSIGIANRQTVVYPTPAPGGWRLIGRTPRVLFDIARESPCLLRPGDRIRFTAIDADAFAHLEQAEGRASR